MATSSAQEDKMTALRLNPRWAALSLVWMLAARGALLPADAGPGLHVDVAASRHSISPYIYGINFATESLARELRLPVCRWGGNATTRYNWKNNFANRANDWFFEDLPETSYNPGDGFPDESSANRFIEQNRRTGADTILTVPMIGWTPKGGRACGFSIAKYGPQERSDPWWADCGNGMRPDGRTKVTGNDPHDTSAEIGPDFVTEWIRYLIRRYGAAGQGIRFYNLDNEPMLWWATHRDVHPQPTTYDEMRDRTHAYAAAIKQADPEAKTLGPVLWGWVAYFYSALDTAEDEWWNKPPQDRNAHGGVPFVEWYLQQMRDYERDHGVRILDYLDLHFYPQWTGVSGSEPGSTATQALRLRSTRALWDPAYRDESWINDTVRLIPRMRQWVNTSYPGTKLAITEYNWGALGDLNGALAQAEILGIFGREELDLATLWGPDADDKPWAYAFRMYRNHDGAGGTFGETSVQATSDDSARLSIFAAQRSSDSALTLIVINKTATDLESSVHIDGFVPGGAARVRRYSAADLHAIVAQPDQPVAQGSFSTIFPAFSITLFAVPPATDLSTSLVFAHVAAGGGFSTTFTICNTGSTAASGRLILTAQSGTPMDVIFSGASAAASSFDLTLQPAATVTVTATRSDAAGLRSGWARVDSAGGLLGGVATFQYTPDGVLKAIAGVLASPAVHYALIPADNDDSKSKYTGFAIANPGTQAIHISVSTLDETGKTADSVSPSDLNPLGPHKQIAIFLHQIIPARKQFRGSVVLTAQPGEQFCVVALHENQGLYTAVPVQTK
jgi:hypothetical protein